MAAVTGRESDRDPGAPERAIEKSHDVEMRDESDRVRLLETQPVLMNGLSFRPPSRPAAPKEGGPAVEAEACDRRAGEETRAGERGRARPAVSRLCGDGNRLGRD